MKDALPAGGGNLKHGEGPAEHVGLGRKHLVLVALRGLIDRDSLVNLEDRALLFVFEASHDSGVVRLQKNVACREITMHERLGLVLQMAKAGGDVQSPGQHVVDQVHAVFLQVILE